MSSNYPKSSYRNLESHKFEIGDLVRYAPYCFDGDGGWVMWGELGIVVGLRKTKDHSYEVVTVRWIDSPSKVDMAPDVLVKIILDK
jgi:hypothetical protein